MYVRHVIAAPQPYNGPAQQYLLPRLRHLVVLTDWGSPAARPHAHTGPTGVVQGRHQGIPRGEGDQHDDVLEKRPGLLRHHPPLQTRPHVSRTLSQNQLYVFYVGFVWYIYVCLSTTRVQSTISIADVKMQVLATANCRQSHLQNVGKCKKHILLNYCFNFIMNAYLIIWKHKLDILLLTKLPPPYQQLFSDVCEL